MELKLYFDLHVGVDIPNHFVTMKIAELISIVIIFSATMAEIIAIKNP